MPSLGPCDDKQILNDPRNLIALDRDHTRKLGDLFAREAIDPIL